MTATLQEVKIIFAEAPQVEILTLPPEEIECILAEIAAKPKRPPDPCLLEDSSAGYSDEPITAYQDSMDAAGYPYW